MATRYRSAAELDITKGERKWLVRSMKVLETLRPRERRKVDGLALGFDMGCVLARGDKEHGTLCDSVGCIKGWMACLAVTAKQGEDLDIPTDVTNPRAEVEGYGSGLAHWEESATLEDLFFPGEGFVDYDKLTPKQAARAIRSFLQKGAPRWPKR